MSSWRLKSIRSAYNRSATFFVLVACRWGNQEIIFHDSKAKPEFGYEGPPIHHFRSSSFQSEREYLKDKWVECLTQSDFNLPIRKVKIYDLHRNLTLTEYYRVFLEEPWPGSGGEQRADQLLNCTAMCDNANGNIHDKNRWLRQWTTARDCTTNLQRPNFRWRQTHVLAVHQNASIELEKWESEFAVNNGFPPMYEDCKTEAVIKSAYKKGKLRIQLWKHWKITVHLQWPWTSSIIISHYMYQTSSTNL